MTVVPMRADAKFCSPGHRIAAHRAQKASGGIPAAMISSPRWIRRAADKTPLQVTGQNASSTNPATWSSHKDAAASRAGVGLGFVLGGGIACIDLDHCLNAGQPTEAAARYIAAYPAHYIEVSPSGDGLHIWGTAPEAAGTRRVIDGLHVERYSTGRYITITKRVFQHGALLPL